MGTVLITGGTGLVGKTLTQQLIKAGYNVIILTRNKKTNAENENVRPPFVVFTTRFMATTFSFNSTSPPALILLSITLDIYLTINNC